MTTTYVCLLMSNNSWHCTTKQ